MADKYFDHYASLEDALTTAIRMSDKENKEIATLLWPHLPIQTAYQRLIDALNPGKNQKLSLYEIKNIMFLCNRFDPIYWLLDECLFERPVKRVVEQEAQQIKEMLEDSFSNITKKYQQLMRMVERQETITAANKGIIKKRHLSSVGEVE